MSLHPSLRVSGAGATVRNVLKRHERVRHLMTQGQWAEGHSALGLPKIKQLRMKARKAAKEKTEEAAAPAAAPAANAAAAAKPSGAKPSA
ncbi:MAG: small basic protein [Candidatus Omnitrophica bacterium]|nr:small basic protein [Candidatus Omnitrophota bacterium]